VLDAPLMPISADVSHDGQEPEVVEARSELSGLNTRTALWPDPGVGAVPSPL